MKNTSRTQVLSEPDTVPLRSSQTVEKAEVTSSTTTVTAPVQEQSKGFGFWMIMLSLCVSMFCSALEITAVPAALPTITESVHGQDFVWVNSAFSLAATSLIPTTGGLADIFGRRIVIFGSFFLFALGSALCGSAENMSWLIAGRSIQGAGSGGIQSLTMIILSDLVSLRERARYNGIIGLVWAVSAAFGPLIGGGFAKNGNWRWLFYMNLPITGFSAALVFFFLKLRTPRQSLREKMLRIDWVGNLFVISSSAAVVIGLSWGGVKFPWGSGHVLAPLILGFVGILAFGYYEHYYATEPIIPMTLLSNRTSISGYIQTFINPLIVLAVVIFQPAYFQACFGSSPIRSGVLMVPCSVVVGVFIVFSSVSVAATKIYRPQLWIGWILLTVACAILTTLKFDSTIPQGYGYPILIGAGGGIMYATTYFPVLAPLPVSENAHALALFAFFRSFAGVWTIAIGSAVLDNTFSKKLSPEVLSMFPGGANGVYFSIPILSSIPDPVRTEVRTAFAEGISLLWKVLSGISGIGLLSCILMKGLPLHTEVDENWGIEQEASAYQDKRRTEGV
ncbi:Mfs1.2 [Abortiporus biennis]|nr:Mfs1.2 [Abortiporus biennis]